MNLFQYAPNPIQYADPFGLKWTKGTPKPKVWRLPKNGCWSGDEGHSEFSPSDPEFLRLKSGDKIPFKDGSSDFPKWSQGNLNIKGLDGSSEDFSKIYDQLAKNYGLANPTAAKNWLSSKGLSPHHAGGDAIELIPRKLHDGIRHTVGARNLRCG